MAGGPNFPGSQNTPEVPYAEWVWLLGSIGIRCDDQQHSGEA